MQNQQAILIPTSIDLTFVRIAMQFTLILSILLLDNGAQGDEKEGTNGKGIEGVKNCPRWKTK